MLCWGLCRESCNQGMFVPGEPEKQESEEVRFMINVNLMGTFHFIKASLPRMRRIGRTVDQHRRLLYHRRPVRWEFMVTWLTRLASLASGDWSKHCNRRSSQTTFMSHLYFLQKQKLEGNEIWLAIVVGSIIGFFGAAFGSAGGVGGGGIFVTMLSLVIGFNPKSATTMSKCMIMGAAGSTIYYNLKLRHPTLDMPIIDYDLALLFQPMLMMGISIVVAFNVVFADWMVAILLIVLFLGTSTMTFLKAVETWKKETIMKKILKTVQEGS